MRTIGKMFSEFGIEGANLVEVDDQELEVLKAIFLVTPRSEGEIPRLTPRAIDAFRAAVLAIRKAARELPTRPGDSE
ncbi:MAG TPA: hypothetical protein VLZ78_10015 [Terrimesophilobacter sp.]|nr:hypothetical protein [Terrimesophilobacter sp.]